MSALSYPLPGNAGRSVTNTDPILSSLSAQPPASPPNHLHFELGDFLTIEFPGPLEGA